MKGDPNDFHPFTGSIIGNVSLYIGHRNYSRAVQVIWGFTPGWPYIDPHSNVEVTGKPFLNFSLQIQPKPSEHVELDIKVRSGDWESVPVALLELLAPYGSMRDLMMVAEQQARVEDRARRLMLRPPSSDRPAPVIPIKFRRRKPKE